MGAAKKKRPTAGERKAASSARDIAQFDAAAHTFGECATCDYSTSDPKSARQDGQHVSHEEESEWVIEGLLRRGEILVVNIFDLEDGEC